MSAELLPIVRTSVDRPRLTGRAYGVGVVLEAATDRLLARMAERLPPSWRPGEPHPDDPRYAMSTEDGLEYQLRRDGQILTSAELEIALGVFDAQLRGFIALHAPDYIFVHAGVVGDRGRAIVIPGLSFSGKTTLVAELVRAGATYYSDEYAVLDEHGLVHPYPKPLSLRLREGSRLQTDRDVAELGGIVGTEPLPVGLIVAANYVAGADWRPRELTAGEAVLELLANTIPAQERPQESLSAIGGAAEEATTLKGDRGEAADIVDQLLDRLAA